MLLAVLAVAMIGLRFEGFTTVALQGAMIVCWAACPLLAAHAGGAGASALRWSIGGYVLFAAAAFYGRDWDAESAGLRRAARQVVVALGVGPVVLLSVFPALAAVMGHFVAGPAGGTLFAKMGAGLSYALPLLVVTAYLAVGAIRRASSGEALAALLAWDVTATAAYVMVAVTADRPFDAFHAVRLVQVNAAATSAFALVWLGGLMLIGRMRGAALAAPAVLTRSVTAALGAVAVLALPGAAGMLFDPAGTGTLVREVGGLWGWVALALSATAATGLIATRGGGLSLREAAVALALLPAMAAFTATGWRRGTWAGFHTWMAAQTAAAWAMLGLGRWLYQRGRDAMRVVTAASPGAIGSPAQTQAAGAASPVLQYEQPKPNVEGPAIFVGGEDVRYAAARYAGGLGAIASLLALARRPGTRRGRGRL